MIKVQNGVASRVPVPHWMPKDAAALADTSWVTDPNLSAQLGGAIWLPEVDETPALGENQVYDGTEVLTPDLERGVVVVVRGIRDMTPEEIQERWLEENPVPAQCTRRQGLLALLSYGVKRSDIEASIEAIEDETEREEAWIEYLADTWELANPALQARWISLGGTLEQLPDLFRLAVTL